MRKQLLFVALTCTSLGAWQGVQAGDIQLRPDNPPEVASGNSATATTAPQGSVSPSVPDTSNMSTKQRLTRLERILNSQGLESMLMRMDNLQSQIEKLRGDLELQAHTLEELKQRQRDLYVDIDRRLVRLERNAPGADLGAPAAAAGTSSGATGSASGAGTQAAAAKTTGSNTSPASDSTEQQAYQNAFNTLRDLRYDQAVKSFRAFLGKYPNGRYAHIAQYWIGEAEYAQRKYKQAIVEYQKLIDKYPTSPKLAEAMLKIGYSQYELKNNKAAQTILNQLIKSYPGTTEAGQAQNLLQKIRVSK